MEPVHRRGDDQTIVIESGRIQAVGPSDHLQVPAGAQRMALPDQTVIPGLVGMHEHLFYPSGGAVPLYIEHGMSFPRLYLAIRRDDSPNGRHA